MLITTFAIIKIEPSEKFEDMGVGHCYLMNDGNLYMKTSHVGDIRSVSLAGDRTGELCVIKPDCMVVPVLIEPIQVTVRVGGIE